MLSRQQPVNRVVCPEPHSPDLPDPEFFAQMTKGDPQREMSEGVNATKGGGQDTLNAHRLSFLAASVLFVSP